MRRRDVSACVRILAAHPVAGPRYGEGISQLRLYGCSFVRIPTEPNPLQIKGSSEPMTVHCRPMLPKDVRPCVEILAVHPVVAPRYGDSIDQLRPAWLSLLGCEAFRAWFLKRSE